jgi:hypothetical protein
MVRFLPMVQVPMARHGADEDPRNYFYGPKLSSGIIPITWIIKAKAVKVDASCLLYWVPIQPSLQKRIVKPVEVIVHPTIDVDFPARKPVNVRCRQRSAGR